MSLAARLMPMMAARAKLSAGLSASSTAASSIGNGPFTTPAVTAIPTGGVAPYTYAWARLSGDSSINVSSSSAAAPTWSASGTAPQTKGATWQCTVTDAAGVAAVTGAVDVQVQFQVSSLSVNVDTTSASASGDGSGPFNTGRVTATPVGGVAAFTYLWELVSGDNSLHPNDSNIQNPYFLASGTAPQTKNAIWRCKVTDSLGTVAYSAQVNVSIQFAAPAMTVGIDVGFTYGYSFGAINQTVYTDPAVTVTPSGGVAPYNYSWERLNGDGSTGVENASWNSTRFLRTGSFLNFYTSTWRCKVTDNAGTIAYSPNLTVDIEFDN